MLYIKITLLGQVEQNDTKFKQLLLRRTEVEKKERRKDINLFWLTFSDKKKLVIMFLCEKRCQIVILVM